MEEKVFQYLKKQCQNEPGFSLTNLSTIASSCKLRSVQSYDNQRTVYVVTLIVNKSMYYVVIVLYVLLNGFPFYSSLVI